MQVPGIMDAGNLHRGGVRSFHDAVLEVGHAGCFDHAD
jgi:hypothetical protein